MSANAVSNTNLTNYRNDLGTTGFVPKVTYAYDAGAKEVDVMEDSDYPAGVALKKVVVKIHDQFGGEARGEVLPGTGSGGNTGEKTISVSALDASRGLSISATVIADDDQLIADGSALITGTSGTLGSWDAQKNA